jgi:hypothetical protein
MTAIPREKTRFEFDRFFRVESNNQGGTGWYYESREGTCGPFPTREMAAESLAMLIDLNPWRRGDEAPAPSLTLAAAPGF